MFKKFKLNRKAGRCLSDLFDRADLREISSLRPDQRSRATLLGYEADGGEIKTIRFGLIRHPQAAGVKGVFNEVIEIYLYTPNQGTVEVIHSRNITKKGTSFS